MAARQNNNKVNASIIPLSHLHSNDTHLSFYDGTSTVGLLFRVKCGAARSAPALEREDFNPTIEIIHFKRK